MKRIPQEGLIGEAALREAAATELEQVMCLVRAALQMRRGDAYCCIEAMYPDRVIECKDGRYYSYAYTIGADNTVTLADPQEVVEQYVPVKMTEAVEHGANAFLEAVDNTGTVWDAVLIRSGLSLNNVFYSDALLREAAPKFEGARVFAKSDEEHTKGKGKDARNIVGWVSGVKFAEGAAVDTGRITGTLNIGAGAQALRDTISDAWKRGKRDLVGLSIDADGTAKTEMRESKKVRVAKTITRVHSVDLIVEPGAGGALVRLIESANTEESDPMKERMLAKIKALAPAVFAKINSETITEDELEQRYAEAVAASESARLTEAALGAAARGEAAVVTQEQLAELMRMTEARAHLRTAVPNSKLPAPAQERLLADFQARAKFTEADVDAAIKAERAYVARFTEAGRVQMDASGDIVVEDRSVKMAAMFDAFFDPAHKNHRATQSFKECYIELTGDKRVTGRLDQMDISRLRESAGAHFRESMDSSTLAYVLGDSVTRRLIADYRQPNQYDIWQPLVNIVPVNDFRTQHRTRFGGYGDLSTVVMGAPYAAVSSPSDEEATYSIAKKGGTEDITLEMIKNDDVGVVRQIPVKLSRAAKRTLSKFVLDFIRTNPTLYDSVAFFHATHGNLGSNALDATYLAAARLRMLKQAEAGSLERLGIGPTNLIVSMDGEQTAMDLFARTTNLDANFVNKMALKIIPVWYWTDTNDWAIGADPQEIPSIEVGFLDGNQEPELFVQDSPTVGSMFTHDKMTLKIRHVYGGQVVNYRGYDKSVVS